MSGRISLVLVTFHSAAVVGEAIESFRAEVRRLGLESEIVLVDHSDNPAELERLSGLADAVQAQPNRGYAAGINTGVAAATGDIVMVGNPDVRFAVGAVEALLEALDSGWDVVGPQFVLGDLLLAPADEQSPSAELWRIAAGWWRAGWRQLLRREVRRWLAVWNASETVAATNLSGALLAARAATWRRFGRWDEGYFLYFEETDWLRRVRGAGCQVGLVPRARVTHLWGHAADPARTAQHFAASRARYFSRHFGVLGRLVARTMPRPARVGPLPLLDPEVTADAGRLWLVSPTGDGLHAATPASGAGPVVGVVEAAVAQRGRPTLVTLMAWDTRSERVVSRKQWEV